MLLPKLLDLLTLLHGYHLSSFGFGFLHQVQKANFIIIQATDHVLCKKCMILKIQFRPIFKREEILLLCFCYFENVGKLHQEAGLIYCVRQDESG